MRARVRWLATGPAILVAGYSFNNVATFGFHVVVSRILGPDGYGALGAVLALTLLVTVVVSSLSLAVVRTVAACPADVAWELAGAYRKVGAIGAAVAAGGLALAPLIASYLHMRSVVPALLLVAIAVVLVLGSVPKGVLLGQHRYAEMAAAIAGSAVLRVGLGGLLAHWAGISGALAACLVAESSASVAAGWLARSRAAGLPLHLGVRDLGLSLAAYSGAWMLSASDQFLARHLLAAHPAGLYVAASTAGSIALWAPFSITSSLYPKLVTNATAARPTNRVFGIGIAGVVLLTGLASGTMAVLPHLVVAVLFGSAYREAASVLVLLAAANGAQGVAGFVLHHLLASRRPSALLPWAALAAVVGGIYLHHATGLQIATVALAVSGGLLVAMAAASLRLSRRHRAMPDLVTTM
jgi:O-antigen/teichoic acid export membrane protein